MIAYDQRFYYNKRQEPFIDSEWESAENADEKPVYYWVETDNHSSAWWKGRVQIKYIKCYKPSVAKLMAERTGYKVYPVKPKEGK